MNGYEDHDILVTTIHALKGALLKETKYWLHVDNIGNNKTVTMCDRLIGDLDVLGLLLETHSYEAFLSHLMHHSVNVSNLKRCFHWRAEGGEAAVQQRRVATFAIYRTLMYHVQKLLPSVAS